MRNPFQEFLVTMGLTCTHIKYIEIHCFLNTCLTSEQSAFCEGSVNINGQLEFTTLKCNLYQ